MIIPAVFTAISSSKAAVSSGWGPISDATYDSVSHGVGTEDAIVSEPYFSSDGTKMYIIGFTSFIRQYSLTTPWDISTGVTLDGSYDLRTDQSIPKLASSQGMTFSPDGTQLFVVGSTGSNAQVNEYALTTAWDITSGVSLTLQRVEAALDDNPTGIEFNDDGTKMYIIGYQQDQIKQYALSSAYDLSTWSTTLIGQAAVSGQQAGPYGLRFKPDGTKCYVTGVSSDFLYEYDLTTAWDITSLTYNSEFLDTSPPDTQMTGIYMKLDGTKFWLSGNTGDAVYAFTFN